MPIIGLSRWPVWRRWFGGRAERAAAKFLRRKGYRVLARNVVLPPGELDMVALDGRTIVFVEVRSTECGDVQRPVESVDAAKLRKKLERSVATGRPLRVKLGIDPTGFDVHLGHTVVLRKLRQFQELGHQVVLIIGTATAAVGDPSGRDKSREGLTPEQIERNAQTYLTQIAKVIDVSRAEVVRNGDWFNRFDFTAMLRLLGQMTMQRMLERDDFDKRLKAGTPIYLHECLYPLMQGYDSVEVRADVELGGSEQLFSLMVGRDLQRDAGQEPQICLTLPILCGLDGVRRMGKSLGN